MFPPKVRNKVWMPTITTSIEYYTGGPHQCDKTRKRNESKKTGTEVKRSLFADNIITFVENPKVFTNKIDFWKRSTYRN